MTDYEKRLRKLLEKLFQFEQSDLDFGIYRIMNQKREEINKFIDTDLIEAVEKALAEYSSVNTEEIKHEIEETKKRILATLGEGSVLANGNVKPEFHTTPLANEYEEKRRLLQHVEISEEHRAEIFNHVYQFFSRYYDNGDFISKRRYSSESKYAIPYNGEEVILHWANKDQYYIKTTEYFNNYAFEVGNYRVQFRVVSAETAQNNNQNGKRYFILADVDNQFSFDAENNELTVFFEYRELSSQEKSDLGNKQEVINEKIEAAILENIEAETLKNFLKREKTKVKKQGKMQSISMLLHHLNSYAKRNTSNYFIHKNLEGFLRRELDFYLKNEVLNLDDLAALSEGDLKRLMARTLAIKKIAIRVIDFLTQIEEFQKKLWEKKKFVVRSDYCMTLDRVPEEFYDEILKNEAQMQEWKELYKLEEIEKDTFHWDRQNNTVRMDADYLKLRPHMMLDTKFFDCNFKDRLLATFDNLDEEIGGLLIKSENWQALNLLMEKYKSKIKCIYLDPPYNTELDRNTAKFLYKDNYEHSSWISLIEERINLFPKLTHDGVAFFSIDDNEYHNLVTLVKNLYGKRCTFGPTIVQSNKGGRDYLPIAKTHEYIACCYLNGTTEINEMEKDISDYRYRDSRGPWIDRELRNRNPRFNSQNRPNLFYPFYVNPNSENENGFCAVSLTQEEQYTIEVYPYNSKGEESVWRWGVPKASKNINPESMDLSNILARKTRTGRWNIYEKCRRDLVKAKSIWDEKVFRTENGTIAVRKLFGGAPFPHPKPVELIERCIILGSSSGDIILDPMAGSGTTGHAVLGLNQNMEDKEDERKYILIEMGNYFESVIIPRLEKVIFSDNWDDGKPISINGMSHMFKYLYLEQYEDTLNNIEFVLPDGTTQKTLFSMDCYFLRYMLDFESRGSPCWLNVKMLDRPFDYTMRIVENGKIHDNVVVDLVETFNYLLGLHVERIKALDCDGHYYRVVYGHKDHDKVVVVWRNMEGLDLARDKDFIETTILWDAEHTKLYVNGQCHVEDALSTEREFKLRMGA